MNKFAQGHLAGGIVRSWSVATRGLSATPKRARRPMLAGSLALSLSSLFLLVSASPVSAVASNPIHNPAANILPSPNFLESGQCTNAVGTWSCDNPCVTSALSWPVYTNAQACTNYVLQAINAGRAAEHLRPMVLPTNWYSLSVPKQLFVIADLERTARGLAPYLGLNAALSVNARRAARTSADPTLAAGFAVGINPQGYPGMGGAWSAGYTVLAADYIWMYDDGWGGTMALTSNIVCTSSMALGCWAHRDQLLGSDPGYNPGVGLNCHKCEMGTGFATVNGTASYVDLIELPKGAPPRMTYTWAKNVKPYLHPAATS
jgi:hypothetical protein